MVHLPFFSVQLLSLLLQHLLVSSWLPDNGTVLETSSGSLRVKHDWKSSGQAWVDFQRTPMVGSSIVIQHSYHCSGQQLPLTLLLNGSFFQERKLLGCCVRLFDCIIFVNESEFESGKFQNETPLSLLPMKS